MTGHQGIKVKRYFTTSDVHPYDQIAYMRFASVYKDFQEITDFQSELDVLLEKKIPAKRRAT